MQTYKNPLPKRRAQVISELINCYLACDIMMRGEIQKCDGTFDVALYDRWKSRQIGARQELLHTHGVKI